MDYAPYSIFLVICDSDNKRANYKSNLIDYDHTNIINNYYQNSAYKKQLLYEHSYNLCDENEVKLLNEAIMSNIFPTKP